MERQRIEENASEARLLFPWGLGDGRGTPTDRIPSLSLLVNDVSLTVSTLRGKR